MLRFFRTNLFGMSVFKFLLVGDPAVGKTTLGLRFSGRLYDLEQQRTVGPNFFKDTLFVGDNFMTICAWETTNFQNCDVLEPHAVLIAYDITNRSSYDKVVKWQSRLKLSGNFAEGIVVSLAGLKLDLDWCRAVPKEEAEKFAKEHKMLFGECSAFTGKFVQELFSKTATEVIERRKVSAANKPKDDAPAKTDNGLRLPKLRMKRRRAKSSETTMPE